jgi:hypothetical protein
MMGLSVRKEGMVIQQDKQRTSFLKKKPKKLLLIAVAHCPGRLESSATARK